MGCQTWADDPVPHSAGISAHLMRARIVFAFATRAIGSNVAFQLSMRQTQY